MDNDTREVWVDICVWERERAEEELSLLLNELQHIATLAYKRFLAAKTGAEKSSIAHERAMEMLSKLQEIIRVTDSLTYNVGVLGVFDSLVTSDEQNVGEA